MRYYQRYQLGGLYDFIPFNGYVASSTAVYGTIALPVPLRTGSPIVDFGGNWVVKDMTGASFAVSTPYFALNSSNPQTANINVTSSGMTTGRWATLQGNANAAYIGFSAEL